MMHQKRFTYLLTGVFVGLLFSVAQISAQQATTLTGLDIAKKTLQYVESVPGKDGLILYFKNCEGNTCAFAQDAFRQTRAWVVLAYIGMYDATGDRIYLDKAKQHMDQVLKNCDPNDSDCQYIGVQADAAYQALKDKKYLAYLKDLDPRMVSIPTRTFQRMVDSIYVRELVLAYKEHLFSDAAAVYRALYFAYSHLQGVDTLASSNGVDLKQTACWTYLADIEFYKTLASLDPQKTIVKGMTVEQLKGLLLVKSKQFFDTFDFASLANAKDIYAVNLTEVEPCAEALLNLYDVTNIERYKQQARTILVHLLRMHWDSEYAKKYAGDNGFTAQGCRSSIDGLACYKNSKVLTDNAYAVYLFSRLKDDKFSITPAGAVSYYQDPKLDPDLISPSPKPGLFAKANVWQVLLLVLILLVIIVALSAFVAKKKSSQPPV